MDLIKWLELGQCIVVFVQRGEYVNSTPDKLNRGLRHNEIFKKVGKL